MVIVQRSIPINASPQETMAQLADANRWPDWYPGMSDLTIADPYPENGGSVKVKAAAISPPMTETVIDYQPGKL
jgi:Polyketide cyclase / dehydrase and lipid transport